MPGHVVPADEPLVAELAAEGQVVLVVPHLVRPELGPTEGLPTDVADKFLGFAVSVSVIEVVVQFSSGGKPSPTETAVEVPLLQVGLVDLLNMGLKVTSLLEKFTTLLTAKLFEARVDQLVRLKLLFPLELFITLITLEGETADRRQSQVFVSLDLDPVRGPLSADLTEVYWSLLRRGVVSHEM